MPRCRRIRKDGLTPNMTTANGRPTFAEIELNALRANYRALCAYTNGASIMAVVKADAYGHGAVEVARTLRQEGCAHFGVATVEEARERRRDRSRPRDEGAPESASSSAASTCLRISPATAPAINPQASSRIA